MDDKIKIYVNFLSLPLKKSIPSLINFILLLVYVNY